ncbi:hypothetical protein [Saccharothrix sp. HUAS TT1]|uniref:hypothetical protein n=1 Tax=unclassified Saccharothrix TaxID=2593673 RepID=UPI00345C4DD4
MSVAFQERFAAITRALAASCGVWVPDPDRADPDRSGAFLLRRWTAADDDLTSDAGAPPADPVFTRVRTVLDLFEGDVVIDPQGRAHRLESKYQVDGISVTMSFDSGVRLYKTWGERAHEYDVQVVAP